MGEVGLDLKAANALKWECAAFMVSKVDGISDFVGMKDVNIYRKPCIMMRLGCCQGVYRDFFVEMLVEYGSCRSL